MLARNWLFFQPGMPIARNIRFEKPLTRKEVLEHLRRWLKQRKLPYGTQIWPNDQYD